MDHAASPAAPNRADAPLDFSSDNAAGASPAVLDALVACASGRAPAYGADPWTASVERRLAELFEHEVAVSIVPTGTAANSLALATLTPPWGSVLCHPDSHINNDECGAPAFFAGGAKLVTVAGPDARIDPARLAAAARAKRGDVHTTQPSAVSITQATEVGSVYTLDEIGAIGEICRAESLSLHMDGARFANALVALGCTPAEMTWRAGVDALSFGATKNGVPGAEAVVLFDTRRAAELAFRRKRAGHLSSKMRFLSAPLDAYLADALWLRNARHANAMAKRLADGLQALPGVALVGGNAANILFCRLPQALTAGLLAAGVRFYHDRWAPGVVRFVTSFATTEDEVDRLLALARGLNPADQAPAA
ncbi:low specificity L-threonine aldolase [Burkholderia glumae]|uniref:threonine aldolase family protein n=1 Tax=Burkholderia glumae TaxID=337 RepID=UPI0002EB4EC1|nr:low specificity L-threonine aldolase [Burkholderia glumae]MCQ0034097.1 low specificity L-threonine aldolase [Burkholderia glumae]MCQ0038687.1 low specificity L-threonine aldolase [Burkholderia glumae]PJO21282.1 low specificity L-threonine aldolase [Burkholderia glumae AU6208]QHE13297.1 low specificity L-threonine aldolase [Burkholderia glumae AU6208]QJW82038.1 low specificity L-threonine aldolase [Burkholderia glumae]